MLFCEAQPYQNPDDPSVHPVFRGRKHVHLMGTDLLELKSYAAAIGLSLRWLQHDRHSVPHFDVTGKWMKRVLDDRLVVKMDRRTFVDTFQSLRPKLTKEQIMPRIKLTKDKPEPEYIPTLEESFTDEYVEKLDSLLSCYAHWKQVIAKAQELMDGDKADILAMLEAADMNGPFQHKGMKWKRRPGSRSTISREALIVAGVPVTKVDAATKVSKFWVLDLDAMPERG